MVVKEFEGQVLIHFRKYFEALANDHWFPMKKGVRLTLEELDNLNKSFVNIEAKVRCLCC